MVNYDYFLSKGQDELISLFKEFHRHGREGHGHFFARIIVKLQFLTGLSNKELAKELGVSKSLISQAKSYLQLASPRLVEWVKQNSLAINSAYSYARIESYREYDNWIPEWIGDQPSRLRKAPPWIMEILKKSEPKLELNPGGRTYDGGWFKGGFYQRGYIVR